MRKFIKNIILFSLLVLTVFYIFDKAITLGLKQSNMVMYENFTNIFNGTIKADLIINGSSKAYVQVDPYIIDSTLNLNSYNLGLDGNPFIPQKLVYELYEKNNDPPTIIVQIVDFTTMSKAEGELYNYIKFAPYLNIDIVRETMQSYEGFSFMDYHFPLLKYTGKPLEVTDGVLSLFNIHLTPSNLYKGYLEQHKSWDGSFEEFKKTNESGITANLDRTTCALFENYIVHCKKQNILLFLVYPPIYYEFIPYDINRKSVIEYFNRVSEKYDVPFLDYSVDELSSHKKYFYNSQHLNAKGAKLFTKKLSNEIKERTNKM